MMEKTKHEKYELAVALWEAALEAVTQAKAAERVAAEAEERAAAVAITGGVYLPEQNAAWAAAHAAWGVAMKNVRSAEAAAEAAEKVTWDAVEAAK